jgi:isoaspartyl peptidase/L-asparaginase-like protein (Ntn-hydrolase superfamily)
MTNKNEAKATGKPLSPPIIIYGCLGGDANPAAARTVEAILDGLTEHGWAFINSKQEAAEAAALPKLLAAVKEVLRISDRKHNAWDAAYAAIAEIEEAAS